MFPSRVVGAVSAVSQWRRDVEEASQPNPKYPSGQQAIFFIQWSNSKYQIATYVVQSDGLVKHDVWYLLFSLQQRVG